MAQRLIIVVVAVLVLGGRVPSHAQIELDRIVARVGGHIITQSDIRQARALKLVENTSSDEATRRGLEDRLLVLAELGRSLAPPASDADVLARRREWEASVGSADIPALLARNGMTEGEIDLWLRDDVRIRAYLRRQFAPLPEAERGKAMLDWMGRLRGRAGVE
jgi:hypothetical protein